MKHTYLHSLIATLAFAALASGPLRAQTLEDAAKQLEDAAGELEAAAATLDGVGVDVEGVEAPTGADGSLYGCSKFERVVVNFKKEEKKVVGDEKTPLVLDASGHCTVVIRNVTLRGDVVIKISGHASMLLENVTIEGKNMGIDISGHASVRLRDSSLAAGKKAMDVSGHASVDIENSTLRGKSEVSGFGTVVYDKKSKTGKLTKSGKFSTLTRR